MAEVLTMMWDLAGKTDVGKKREENQDGFLSETYCAGTPREVTVVAVADGMGGHEKGRQASETALEVLRESFGDGAEGFQEAAVLAAIETAHRRIVALAEAGETVGTTLTFLLLRGREGLLVHVGDSRAYRVTARGIRQLTEDHTWEAWAARTGEPNPYGRALRQALGVEGTLDPQTRRVSFDPGETLLVSSDGLHKYVADADILRLTRGGSAADAVARLVDAALDTGGRDNVAVVVLRFPPAASPSLLSRLLTLFQRP